MFQRSWIVGVIAAAALTSAGAAADEPLRLGDPLLSGPAPSARDGVSLTFTPRQAGVFDLETARFDLALTPMRPEPEAEAAGIADVAGGRFAVGGALDFGGVEITGHLVGERGERVSSEGIDASLGFGAVTTRMRYVEEERDGEDAVRYGLGAELDAAPGLSVGADLSVAEGEGVEDPDGRDTEGVVRFRLSF